MEMSRQRRHLSKIRELRRPYSNFQIRRTVNQRVQRKQRRVLCVLVLCVEFHSILHI